MAQVIQGDTRGAIMSKKRFKRFGMVLLAGVVSGSIAGFIAGGIGSRLAMRVVALVAGKEFYGVPTEADELVGQITRDGTMFLLLAGAIFPIPFGLAFVALRGAIPGLPGWRHGLIYGALLYAVFGSAVIDGENFDFTLFVSPYLAVGLFLVLFPLYGVVASVIAERIAPSREPYSRSIRLALWFPLLVATAIGMSKNVDALRLIFG